MSHHGVKRIVKVGLICGILFMVIYRVVVCKYINIETQTAERGELKDSIETIGIAVRDEEVLESKSYGASNLKYLLSDGEKTPKNGVLAEVYADVSDAKASYKIENINKKIEVLERLNLSRYNIFKGINFINKQINDEIKNLLISLDDVKLLESELRKQNILYLLSEKHIVLGKDVSFDGTIKSLQQEKAELLRSSCKSGDVIKSPASGEFISHIDGYENVADYKNILHFDFRKLNGCEAAKSSSDSHFLGKIIKSETWYMVCKIGEEEAGKMHIGEEVRMGMPFLDFSFDIPARVEGLCKSPESQEYFLVLSCDYMNKDLARIRKETVKINLAEYTGIRLGKSCVHKFGDEFEWGVYVKCAGYLKKKKVNPIFWKSAEVMCSYDSQNASDENYLQPGDAVVAKGANLYEGKRV